MNILHNNTESSPKSKANHNLINASFSHDELREDSLNPKDDRKLTVELRTKANSGAGLFPHHTGKKQKTARYGQDTQTQLLN